MGETVVEVDFGKDARESFRIYARLAGLIEQQETEFLKDPGKFFEHAADQLRRRDDLIRLARKALVPRITAPSIAAPTGPIMYEPRETIRVLKEEFGRLRACAEIVERGIE